MAALISKVRSIKSRQRDREDRKSARRPWPVACIMLVLFLWLATLATLHVGGAASLTPLAPGQLVTEAVISKVDFKCVDLAETEMSRRRAEDAVLPVFRIGYDKYADGIRTMEKLFRHLADIRSSGDQYPSRKEKEQAVEKVLDLLGIALDPAAFLKAVPEEREKEILGLVSNALKKAYAGGIVSEADLSSAYKGLVRGTHIQIHQEDGTLQRVSFKGLASPVSALAAVAAAMETALELKPAGVAVWRDLLRPWVVPSLVYQADTTEQLRRKAAEAVSPAETLIRTGTVLVEAGATVDAAVSEKLLAHLDILYIPWSICICHNTILS